MRNQLLTRPNGELLDLLRRPSEPAAALAALAAVVWQGVAREQRAREDGPRAVRRRGVRRQPEEHRRRSAACVTARAGRPLLVREGRGGAREPAQRRPRAALRLEVLLLRVKLSLTQTKSGA